MTKQLKKSLAVVAAAVLLLSAAASSLFVSAFTNVEEKWWVMDNANYSNTWALDETTGALSCTSNACIINTTDGGGMTDTFTFEGNVKPNAGAGVVPTYVSFLAGVEDASSGVNLRILRGTIVIAVGWQNKLITFPTYSEADGYDIKAVFTSGAMQLWIDGTEITDANCYQTTSGADYAPDTEQPMGPADLDIPTLMSPADTYRPGSFVILGNLTNNTNKVEFSDVHLAKGETEAVYFYDSSKPATAKGVTLDKNTLTVEAGKSTAPLVASVQPSNATNRAVTWTSSDETVATVADGVVTGVKEGTATITVKTADGNFTKTCAVTVTPGEDTGALEGDWNAVIGDFTQNADKSVTGKKNSGDDYVIMLRGDSFGDIDTGGDFTFEAEFTVPKPEGGYNPVTFDFKKPADGLDEPMTGYNVQIIPGTVRVYKGEGVDGNIVFQSFPGNIKDDGSFNTIKVTFSGTKMELTINGIKQEYDGLDESKKLSDVSFPAAGASISMGSTTIKSYDGATTFRKIKLTAGSKIKTYFSEGGGTDPEDDDPFVSAVGSKKVENDVLVLTKDMDDWNTHVFVEKFEGFDTTGNFSFAVDFTVADVGDGGWNPTVISLMKPENKLTDPYYGYVFAFSGTTMRIYKNGSYPAQILFEATVESLVSGAGKFNTLQVEFKDGKAVVGVNGTYVRVDDTERKMADISFSADGMGGGIGLGSITADTFTGETRFKNLVVSSGGEALKLYGNGSLATLKEAEPKDDDDKNGGNQGGNNPGTGVALPGGILLMTAACGACLTLSRKRKSR